MVQGKELWPVVFESLQKHFSEQSKGIQGLYGADVLSKRTKCLVEYIERWTSCAYGEVYGPPDVPDCGFFVPCIPSPAKYSLKNWKALHKASHKLLEAIKASEVRASLKVAPWEHEVMKA